MADPQTQLDKLLHRRRRPFRSTVFRGLSVLLPPLMTVVIFVWIGSTINQNVLRPVEHGVRNAIVWRIADVRDALPGVNDTATQAVFNGTAYVRLESGEFVPASIVRTVRADLDGEPLPQTGRGVYEEYVQVHYLQPQLVVPVFVIAFLLIAYLVGKFLAAEIGAFLWGLAERGIGRLPLVRNIYSSVKQVTDFMLNEQPQTFTRVVAVEYPCKGVWAVGFVTSESLLDIRAAVNEPIVAVLVPCSPMPMAARSVAVRKREVVELKMTVDQALQFIVSCGVVVPPHQRTTPLSGGPAPRLAM
ncbi:MAG TPA: DUF502 domain-containing protein [Pirellulales bacterium]|jgi:uncharacterized membrane protein|nr:DUF502 domain-containing protein [Pirellulales bacterium]